MVVEQRQVDLNFETKFKLHVNFQGTKVSSIDVASADALGIPNDDDASGSSSILIIENYDDEGLIMAISADDGTIPTTATNDVADQFEFDQAL